MKMAQKYYYVAEHCFAVQTSNDVLMSLMTNYEPFVTTEGEPHNNAIFVLHIEQNGLLRENTRLSYAHIFTDNSEIDMPRIEVYKNNEGNWLFRISMIADSPICCEVTSNASFSEAQLHIAHDCQDTHFCIDNALMLLYAFRTAPLKTLEMHAAVVVKEQTGYVFLGHSGTGKSTHARKWLEAFPDAHLLNDDNPIIRLMDNQEIRVYGSPWSGKTPCYKNAHATLRGIVKLTQAPNNLIHSIPLPEAYAHVYSSASGMKIERTMVEYLYNTVSHIVTHIPCYLLQCLPNTDAAQVCWEKIKTETNKQF